MQKLDERDYQRFTIKERLDLTIAALSRKDHEEIARLRRTCPRKQYTMLDYEYTSKLASLPWIASQFSELQNFYYNKMIIFISTMGTTKETDKVVNLHLAFVDQVASFKALYAAFYAFCEDAGLNRHHLLEWLKIDTKPMHEFIGEEMMAKVEPDNELALHIKMKFLTIWNDDFTDTGCTT